MSCATACWFWSLEGSKRYPPKKATKTKLFFQDFVNLNELISAVDCTKRVFVNLLVTLQISQIEILDVNYARYPSASFFVTSTCESVFSHVGHISG